jgi:hypothetical protein
VIEGKNLKVQAGVEVYDLKIAERTSRIVDYGGIVR